jgi:hypothetical protein
MEGQTDGRKDRDYFYIPRRLFGGGYKFNFSKGDLDPTDQRKNTMEVI